MRVNFTLRMWIRARVTLKCSSSGHSQASQVSSSISFNNIFHQQIETCISSTTFAWQQHRKIECIWINMPHHQLDTW
jgi:hypothetical protein